MPGHDLLETTARHDLETAERPDLVVVLAGRRFDKKGKLDWMAALCHYISSSENIHSQVCILTKPTVLEDYM